MLNVVAVGAKHLKIGQCLFADVGIGQMVHFEAAAIVAFLTLASANLEEPLAFGFPFRAF